MSARIRPSTRSPRARSPHVLPLLALQRRPDRQLQLPLRRRLLEGLQRRRAGVLPRSRLLSRLSKWWLLPRLQLQPLVDVQLRGKRVLSLGNLLRGRLLLVDHLSCRPAPPSCGLLPIFVRKNPQLLESGRADFDRRARRAPALCTISPGPPPLAAPARANLVGTSRAECASGCHSAGGGGGPRADKGHRDGRRRAADARGGPRGGARRMRSVLGGRCPG